jgi:hypothetical protein
MFQMSVIARERTCEEVESPHPEEAALLGGRLEGWP